MLTASPEPEVVQRALDIARPALTQSEAPRLDPALLSAVRTAQLVAFWREREALLEAEDEEILVYLI